MKKVLYKVRKHLRKEADIKKELQKIIISSAMAIMSLMAIVIFSVFDFFYGEDLNFYMDLGLLFIYVIGIYININGYHFFGKILIIVCTNILLAVNGSNESAGIGNYFIWFPLICSCFLVFDYKEKSTIALLLAFSFLCMGFVTTTKHSFFFQKSSILTEYIMLDFFISLVLSIFLVIIFIYYLVKTNNKNQLKMNRLILNLNAANDELTKANTELDSFVYKASHDLRSPLTSVLGLINLLKIEKNPDRLLEYINLQEKAVTKLDGYIYDILNISKNARMGVSMENIDFDYMINTIFEQLGYADNTNKIQMKVNISSTSPFYSDLKRLHIVFSNLISNSIRYADFLKPNPEIVINIVANSKLASIVIRDNGYGIKDEYKDKIYNMFFRATDKKAGSGLGLYIVKETIMKLNGNIKMISEDEKWTEFTIVIPNLLYKKLLSQQSLDTV